MKPIIGITLDWQREGSFAQRPHYALRTHYFEAVHHAGGIPFGIPYHAEHMEDYINHCDGFLSPGGECASPNEWYVDEEQKEGSPHGESPRVEFELALTMGFLEKDKPVLGICQGMQQLGGLHGCRMTGDVHTYLKTDINHAGGITPPEEYAYDVTIEEQTLLRSVVGQEVLPVNTSHREALVTAGEGVVISARSPDSCIQGIELPAHKFAVGVQWHPEFFVTAEEQGHQNIFKALVNAV